MLSKNASGCGSTEAFTGRFLRTHGSLSSRKSSVRRSVTILPAQDASERPVGYHASEEEIRDDLATFRPTAGQLASFGRFGEPLDEPEEGPGAGAPCRVGDPLPVYADAAGTRRCAFAAGRRHAR